MTAIAFLGPSWFISLSCSTIHTAKQTGKILGSLKKEIKEYKCYDVRLRKSQYGLRSFLITVCRNSQKEKIIDAGKLFNLVAYGVIRINGWIVKLDKSNFEIMHNFLTVRGIEQKNG